MRERATAESFNREPARDPSRVRDLFPQQPEPGWSRRKRIGVVTVALLVGMLIGPHLPILRQPSPDRLSRPAPLDELHFPKITPWTPGSKLCLTASEETGCDDPSATWEIPQAQTWTRIGCRNATAQGAGDGHDITVTVWRGSSPDAMQRMPMHCTIEGSDKPMKCRGAGPVTFQADDLARVEVQIGNRIAESVGALSCWVLRRFD
jgi:hypothetical protein